MKENNSRKKRQNDRIGCVENGGPDKDVKSQNQQLCVCDVQFYFFNLAIALVDISLRVCLWVMQKRFENSIFSILGLVPRKLARGQELVQKSCSRIFVVVVVVVVRIRFEKMA